MRRVIQERFELIRRIGRGGMGEVWEAKDLRLKRLVAVKLLRLDGAGGGSSRLERRFEQEADLLARLGHPGVPVIHDTGRHESDALYIAMELVHGQTLADRLKEHGPFPVTLAASVAVQTVEVLAEAHQIPVIHRDLKPSNLMLTDKGTLKVLDFGIAAARQDDPDAPRLTGTNDLLGTPGFISPEQGLGKPATARSDLYALGCVLYEILTGKPPFELQGGVPLALLFKHVHDKPVPVTEHRADLPAEFADLVMRLLAKDPADRPSVREVREVARTWMEPQAIPGPRTSSPDRAAPASSRARRVSDAESAPSAASLSEEVRALAARGEHVVAAALLEEHLRGTRRRLDDTEVLPLRLTYAELLIESEEFTTAYEVFFGLGGALRQRRPATDRDVLVCRAGAARCLSELGRTPEARHEYEALLPVQQHVFGPMDRAVFDTRYEIAALTARGGLIESAQAQLTGLDADQQRVLPRTDPRHARAAALLERLDRFERRST
ncbi:MULTISPECIES: protein kinase [unclassified Streptomyces]|uniref:serine/threonine-protein kinase n=1 Tax=unclassified Streptomyces TaxID=2593676 RepID=UPI0035D97B63